MIDTTFDTLQASKDLQDNGFDREQAEAITQVVRNGQRDLAIKSSISSIKWIIRLQFLQFIIMFGGFAVLVVITGFFPFGLYSAMAELNSLIAYFLGFE